MTFPKTTLLLIPALLLLIAFSFFSKDTSLQNHADRIFAACRAEDYSRACYDKEIPKLMDFLSMKQAFEVARLIQEKDPSYLECHVLAHFLAERETAKDKSRWKDVVASCPVSMCNNGCPHGALMARFGNENEFLSDEQIQAIKPDLQDVCEPRGTWNPSEVERSMCYHAIGHLNMYATNANINKSVELCQDIGLKQDGRNYAQTCTEGVLMSVFQPLGPEDTALVAAIRPSRETVNSFCQNYTGEAFHACHRESWPLFAQDVLQPQGLTQFCSYTTDESQQVKCYSSLMNLITNRYVVDQEGLGKLEEFCKGLPRLRTGLCFEQAARRLIQIDPLYTNKALEVCRLAETLEVGDVCYNRLVSYALDSFHAGSEAFLQYCKALPSPWNTKCIEAR